MDAAAIASHINDLNGLSGKDAKEILPMLEKFPYSSSLHIIYLKALANDNSLEFESKLKIAAAHVSDKEHLYHLINDNTSSSDAEKVQEAVIEEAEHIVEDVPEKIEPIKVDKIPVEEIIEKEEVEEKIEEPIITETQIKEEVRSIIEEETREIETEEVETEESSLDEEIFSHAIASAFEIDSEEVIEENVPEKDIPAEIVLESKTDKIEPPEDMTFIEWLQFKKTGKIENLEEISSKELDSNVSENIETEVPEQEEKKMSKKEINALLDRFISEQPSISKPVKDQFNPSSNAKESVEESTEVVSETLAQIHVMQGNYSKAIKAYKQLSLLYPEKKVFFASQIKKIESKLG
jgi:hypothetical protein